MTSFYEALAALLEYPDGDWPKKVHQCGQIMERENPGLVSGFGQFTARIKGVPLTELQERYTHAFDLNPVCALEVGFHLFGENYKRGVFLANLRETESSFDLGQGHQLPDYLPVLLRLLDHLEDAELRSSLISECLIPAVNKMNEALRKIDSPYADLMAVIGATLQGELAVPSDHSLREREDQADLLPVLNSNVM